MAETARPTGRPRTAPPGGLPGGPPVRTGPPTQQQRPPIAAKPKRSRHASRVARVLGYVALYTAPLFILVAVAAAVGYVKLRHSPISLTYFVKPIERGINAGLVGMTAKVDGAELVLTESGGVELRLRDLEIAEADGDRVASAPLAAVGFDMGSMLRLEAVPSRVYLIEPKLHVIYSPGGGLALSFSDAGKIDSGTVDGGPAEEAASVPQPVQQPVATGRPSRSLLGKLDLARWWTETTTRARRGEDVTSGLREVGIRNATVVLDYEGRRSHWQVAEASVDLDHHKRRSVVSGTARVMGARGPWAASFRAEDSERTGIVGVTLSVRDLNPSTLSKSLPELALLEALDLPLSGDGSAELSSAGDLQSASITLGLGAGHLALPGLTLAPARVDAGKVELHYDGQRNEFTLAPSTLTAGASHVTLEGGLTAVTGRGGRSQWRYRLASKDGAIGAEEFGVVAVPITALSAEGVIVPGEGAFRLESAKLAAGGAEVSLTGELASAQQGTSARFEGKMGPMSLDTLKAIWPSAVAPAARSWIGRSVTRGKVQSATLRMVSGEAGAGPADAGKATGERLSVAMELSDLLVTAAERAPPVEIPRALVRMENDALEVTIPDATLGAGPQKSLSLKGGRFTAVNVTGPSPAGEAVFRVVSTLPAVLAVASRPPFALIDAGALPLDGVDGKLEGQFRITLPLTADAAATPPKVQGQARISDLRLKQKFGATELQGGTIDLDVTEQAINATGDLLVNGVIAKLDWQRIFDAPPERQPPIRIKATLDNSDRNQLGLDVNHIIQGDMPVEITVANAVTDKPAIHVRADLTGAELVFHDIAWNKPAGRATFLDFDVGKGQNYPLELHNLKIAGDNVAVEGWAAINAENDLAEFYYPDFSLNVVSRLEVRGKLGADRVWKIKASGSTYDARDFFGAVFSLGGDDQSRIKALRPAAGIDLEAEVTNVLGHNELAARNLKLKLTERGDKLVSLSAEGALDGGKKLWAQVKKEASGERQLTAGAGDAGQAFKLAGFYRNVIGGHVDLVVNLDGRGAAAKTGILVVQNFRVLGDPIVSEVIASAGGSSSVSGEENGRRVVREVYDFDQMRVPFSAGHDQFVLEDSHVRGPLLGATISGKVDFKAQRLNLGGTYIPLQGINSALCAIPLFGAIITGPKCEGVFGITYAVQGAMSQPQVLVNPLSMLTPGILREIMQMTDPNQKVLPRESKRSAVPVSQRTGNSSSEPVRADSGSKARPAATSPQTIDGWSSETTGPGKKK